MSCVVLQSASVGLTDWL